MNAKPIIGRYAAIRPEYTRTLPNHLKNVPWKHEVDRVQELRTEAKHWAVIIGLVAAVAFVWFVLPWGGR